MELNFKRVIEDSLVSTTITIGEFGSGEDNLSAKAEEECLKNWKIVLNYEDLIFDRYITINENHVPEIVEISEPVIDPENPDTTEPVTVDGDRVQFAVGDEPVTIDKDMEIYFAVDARNLRMRDSYTHIRDSKDLAMSMVLIFEQTVKEYIENEMKENIKHYNGFEKEFTERI